MATRIFIFSIVLGAEYLSYVKSIATFALTFFWYIISILASVFGFSLLSRFNYLAKFSKVRTFWETQKIWKNLLHGFDKSAALLSQRQNQKEDLFKLCVLLKKSELYQ